MMAMYVAMLVFSVGSSVMAAQRAKKLAKKNRGHLYQVREAAFPRRTAYGRVRVGAFEAHVASSGSNNKYIHYIMVWGDGPFQQVESLMLDNDVVTFDGSGNAIGK
jgi:hypothetical protein